MYDLLDTRYFCLMPYESNEPKKLKFTKRVKPKPKKIKPKKKTKKERKK